MFEPSVEQRIFGAAFDELDRRGLHFGDGAAQQLWDTAQQAAAEIAGMPPQAQAIRVAQAQAAFRLFALRMIQARDEISGYRDRVESGAVDKETHDAARTELRIWPFTRRP